MPQGPRTERVGEELREILAEEVQRLKDPRIGFVTITGVTVSADLRRARVFYTAFGEERERVATRAALRSAAAHLRHQLGAQVHIKVTPELEFVEDRSSERGAAIDRILDQLHREERE